MNYYDTPVHNMFVIVRFIKCKVDCSGAKSKFRLCVMCYRDVYCTGLTFFLTGGRNWNKLISSAEDLEESKIKGILSRCIL